MLKKLSKVQLQSEQNMSNMFPQQLNAEAKFSPRSAPWIQLWMPSCSFYICCEFFSSCLANAKRTNDGYDGNSVVTFTIDQPHQSPNAPPPLRLKKILDMAPITITDQTPMETVIDMFRKLGLRQTLVTHNGYVKFIRAIIIDIRRLRSNGEAKRSSPI